MGSIRQPGRRRGRHHHVAVFSGFSHDIMIKQGGFALAAGILTDAFLVRMTLVSALMALFKQRAWWLPRWLDRLLPNLEVEGEKLVTMLNQQPRPLVDRASSVVDASKAKPGRCLATTASGTCTGPWRALGVHRADGE